MGVRHEKVILDLEDRFTGKMTAATAATIAYERALKSLDGTAVRIVQENRSTSRSLGDVAVQADRTATSTRTAGKEIDAFSGRLRILAQVAAILGPGLIPIGAVLAPAAATLAAGLGAVAVAGASAIAAFQGVGEATKALDAYDLEPTAANLEAAQQAMAQLGPDARGFVMAWQDFQPTLTGLRDAAAAGWFPGLVDSLDSIEQAGGQLERILENVGRAGGQAVSDFAADLAGPRYADFLSFLERAAPSAVTSLATSVGDLTHGMTELMMALNPGIQGGFGWIEDVAAGFDRWASSAQGREDIAAFLDYVRQTGPQVQDLFGSLVNAVAQVVQAAAPLGGPVLVGLTAAFDVIGAIADSDLGTPIMAGVAALSIFNRTMAATAALQRSTFGRAAAGSLAAGGGFAGMLGRQTGTLREAGAALLSVTSAQDRARLSSAQLEAAERKKTAAIRAGLGTLGRGAAVAGGLAVATTGVADSFGLSNTASLALMGTIAGPWGAAIGAGVGLIMDMKGGAEDLESAFDALQTSMDAGAFTQYESGLSKARDELMAFKADVDGDDWKNLLDPKAWKNTWEGWLGDSEVEERTAEFERLRSQMFTTQRVAADLGRAMGETVGPLDGSARSARELEQVMAAAQPAMERLGITQERLFGLQARQQAATAVAGGKNFFGFDASDVADLDVADDAIARIAAEVRRMDSESARLSGVGEAFAGLSADMLPAAEAAQVLKQSLEELLNPALGAEAATDAWRASLQALRAELDAGAGFKGFSEGALANRAATREYVAGVQERLTAMAANGAGEAKLAKATAESRREFIQAGVAAGFSAEAMRRRANAIGLTPKLVKTTFQALGITKVDLQVAELRQKFKAMPPNVKTAVRAEGIPSTMGQVNQLVAKYKLTEQERRALITLKDAASGKAEAVKRLLDIIQRTTPNPRVSINDQASPIARGIQAAINAITGKTVTITTRRVEIYERRTTGAALGNASGGIPRADGGLVTGPGGPRDDVIPAWLSNGEFVVNAASTAKNLALLHELNSQRYASGGQVDRSGPIRSGGRPQGADLGDRADFNRVMAMVGYAAFNPVDRAAQEAADALNSMVKGSKEEQRSRKRLLDQAVKREEKERDAARERLDAIREESKAIRESVKQRLTSDLFGQTPELIDPMADLPEDFGERSAAAQRSYLEARVKSAEFHNAAIRAQNNPLALLQGDIDRAREFDQLRGGLRRRGVDGDALQFLIEQGDIDYLRELATGPRSAATQFERLFNDRERVVGAAGRNAAAAVNGSAERAATVALREQTAELKQARREQRQFEARQEARDKRMEQLAERAPERTGKEVGREINGAQLAGTKGRGR